LFLVRLHPIFDLNPHFGIYGFKSETGQYLLRSESEKKYTLKDTV
jgi:hypothetical protein